MGVGVRQQAGWEGARRATTRRWMPLACGGVWLAVATAGAVLVGLRQEVAAGEAAQATRAAAPLPDALPAVTRKDFVEQLPPATALVPGARAMVQAAQAAAAAQGVRPVSVSQQMPAVAWPRLARSELTFAWQGPYPKVKAVLAATMAAAQGVVLQRLEIRKANAGDEIEAMAMLTLLARPAHEGLR